MEGWPEKIYYLHYLEGLRCASANARYLTTSEVKRRISFLKVMVLIMASGRNCIRFTMDVALSSDEARTAFKNRLSSVRDLLSPPGGPTLDNLGLMTALFDLDDPTLVRTALLLWRLLEAYTYKTL